MHQHVPSGHRIRVPQSFLSRALSLIAFFYNYLRVRLPIDGSEREQIKKPG